MCLLVVLNMFNFLSSIVFLMLTIGKFYTHMDKETLIKLAQPAATALLALSILSFPFIVKASGSMTVYQGDYSWRISGCN